MSLDDPTHYLRPTDFHPDEEEDEDNIPPWRRTAFDCEFCGESILYEADTVLATLVVGHVVEGHVRTDYMLDEDGYGVFAPIYLHFDCWDSHIAAEAYELTHGEEPRRLPQEAIGSCEFCKSEIGEGMEVVLVRNGCVKRHKLSARFDDAAEPFLVCRPCMNVIDVEIIEGTDDE